MINLSNINKEYIDKYIKGLVPDRNEFFKGMEEYASENHIPIIEPEVAQYLKVHLKAFAPRKILEIGTAIGYSAIRFAEALGGEGFVTTIERREDMIELALENITASGYKKNINILQGEADEILPTLKEKYDVIFIDAAKGHYLELFNMALDLLEEDGMVICDNVLFRGMVATDKLVVRRKKTIVKRMRKFLKHINNLEGFSSTVIPIGDGLALIYRER